MNIEAARKMLEARWHNSKRREARFAAKRRLSTARHEAGHALLLLVYGIPFKDVEILPKEIVGSPNFGFVRDGEDLVRGVVRSDRVLFMRQGCSFHPHAQVIELMAGVAGEQIEYKQAIWRFMKDWVLGGAGNDFDKAKYLTESCALDKVWDVGFEHSLDAYLRHTFETAWSILRKHKVKHDALVAALLDKSFLTYKECVEICEVASIAKREATLFLNEAAQP